jgi:biopolymer transport protein ExbB
MKGLFNVIVIVAAFAVTLTFYYTVMGDASRFTDAQKATPKDSGDLLAKMYTGGPLVAVLLAFIIIAITFVIERTLSINKAKGTGKMEDFVKKIQGYLIEGNIQAAMEACDKQRGSLASIVRAGLEKFQMVQSDASMADDKKMIEVKRAIDEATNLETPLLEKNLVMLSTISSIATMVGLLGTTLGMIKAFEALGQGGSVSATQLSLAISEALYNTAGGLAGAVIAIVAYNYFTTKVDNFTYLIDEAVLSVTDILTVRMKK